MGRKCRRELGNEDKFMIDLFLLPFYVFKWVFPLAVWYYGIVFLTNSEMYENASEKLKDKFDELRKK